MELSIIIVSYNTCRLLNNCLKAVFKELESSNLSEQTEVIVVDNASKDTSVKMVKKTFPKTKLVLNKENTGFGKANNIGIKKAKGKFILLLNSDTEITAGTFKKILVEIKKEKNIGVIGCRLLNKDKTTQQSAGYFPNLLKVFLWMMFLDDIARLQKIFGAYHMSDNSFYEKEQEVDWVSGACFLVRREVCERAGLFDENIFMYAEELEWCYRIKKTGYKILYTPSVGIYHFKGGSAQKNRQNSGIIEEFETLIYFYKKYKSLFEQISLRILILSGILMRIVLFAIIGRYNYRVDTYVKAIFVVGR